MTPEQAERSMLARRTLRHAEQRTGAWRDELSARYFPVSGRLRGLMPHGIRRGTAMSVRGSLSLAYELVAQASRDGSWVALVGMPDAGVLAALDAGINSERFALVPTPGADAAPVLAALADGMDMVLVGPAVIGTLTNMDRRRVTARFRERGCSIVALGSWPDVTLSLTVTESRWQGVGQGHGRLRSHTVRVHRQGKGMVDAQRLIELEGGQSVLRAPSNTGWAEVAVAANSRETETIEHVRERVG